MNKQFRNYLIFWLAMVSLFNVACFVSPAEVNGFNKYAGAFWPGYIFIMIAFAIHLGFSYFMLAETNRKKKILNAPLIVISFIELAIMVIAGTVCMGVPDLPAWLGIIICYAVLVLSIVFLVSAKVVGENTLEANIALNEKTDRFRGFTASASELLTLSADKEIKQSVQKVYDAIRYSDPVSSADLNAEETEIESMLDSLKNDVINGAADNVKAKADKLCALVEARNNRCMALKRKKI